MSLSGWLAVVSEKMPILSNPNVGQFLRFAVIGCLSVAVDVACLFSLYSIHLPGGELFSVSLGQWLINHHLSIYQSADLLTKGVAISREAAVPAIQLVSGTIATVVSFYANRSWTFQVQKSERKMRHAVWFFGMYAATLLLHDLVLTTLNHFTILIVAKAVAIAVTTVVNFAGQKFLIFRKTPEVVSD